MYRLIIEDDEGQKSVVPLIREQVSIGRREGNNIRLTERNVSRRHARVIRDEELFFVEDLNSYNGIRLNGERVAGRQPLHEGDLVEIGDYHLSLRREAVRTADVDTDPIPSRKRIRGDAKTEPMGRSRADTLIEKRPTALGPPKQMPPVPASAPESAAGAARLVVLTPAAGLREVPIPPEGAVLGTDGDIRLPPRGIAPHHAEVALVGGVARIRDLGGGVRVNGEGRESADLRDGDLVELGSLKLRFIAPPRAPALVPSPMVPSDLHVKTQPDYRIPVPVEREPIVARSQLNEPESEPAEPRRKAIYFGIGLGVVVLGVGLYLALRPATPGKPIPDGSLAPRLSPPPKTATPGVGPSTPSRRPSAAPLPALPPERPATAASGRLPALSPTVSAAELLARAQARERAGRWRAAEQLYRRAARAGAQLEAEEALERIRAARAAARRRAALAKARVETIQPIPHPAPNPLPAAARAIPDRASPPAPSPPRPVAASRLPPPARRIDSPPEKGPTLEELQRKQALRAAQARRRGRARSRRLFKKGTKILLSSPVQAIGILRQAMRADPRFADVHKNLGIAYGAVGNSRAAARHYRIYLKMLPQAPDAATVRRLVEDLRK